MELILVRGLPHQQKAVDALASVFKDVKIDKPKFPYENPSFNCADERLRGNITEIQEKNVCCNHRTGGDDKDYLNLDIKMETGTGKTYVYTHAIYELHNRYGFNKFIVVVPSLSIKAGAKQFLGDSYVKRHFSDVCGYNCNLELSILESQQSKNARNRAMPSSVREFVSGSCHDTNKIHVLLLNMQLLTNGKMLRSAYDYAIEGFYVPLEALCATKPVIIIDEPHRFMKNNKAFKIILDDLKPQMIIRFGATFPEISGGKGRNKPKQTDLHNLIYELNACDAFNLNLIKGIAKEHVKPLSEKEEKVKLLAVKSKTSAKFQLKKRDVVKSFELKVGESLSVIDTKAFQGLSICGITSSSVVLSNGQEKRQGEEFNTDVYSSSYLEPMIKIALQRHFETERRNFSRQYKIKTLALFFIDDITSYRESKNGKEPYLREMFERLLREKLESLINELSDDESEYREYLTASKSNIAACHAGYFSQDNSDASVAEEVNDILYNKKKLISLRNEDGKYNTRRFLFSKWTLKEGWDNPNVFTIAKLRSSASETSKLQEVGRGLRLPVDENGNRISNEEFKLNYIVDFTEADFAEKLVEEINGDLPYSGNISDEELTAAAKRRNTSPDSLFADLLKSNYINRKYEIVPENCNSFFDEYPEFARGVSAGKIVNRNVTKKSEIHIQSEVYSELKDLWESINQKYYLFYDADMARKIPAELSKILDNESILTPPVVNSRRNVIVPDGRSVASREETGESYYIDKPLRYCDFLKRISIKTNIPIRDIHSAMCELSKKREITPGLINEYSATNIINKFAEWKINDCQVRFCYSRSSQPITETALTNKSGAPKKVIAQGRIGTKIEPGTPSKKYLYDTIAYDSPLEKENIMTDIDEVIVYGKIPRASISIPTVVGETYSPDFMYVVKHSNGKQELVVETKSVETMLELRDKERAKIRCAEK